MKELMTPDNTDELTLKEVCERCPVSVQQIITLVEYGVVEPKGRNTSEWRFTSTGYLRIRKAIRLQKDLSINESGVALAIDLLDKLESANREIEFLKRQIRQVRNQS